MIRFIFSVQSLVLHSSQCQPQVNEDLHHHFNSTSLPLVLSNPQRSNVTRYLQESQSSNEEGGKKMAFITSIPLSYIGSVNGVQSISLKSPPQQQHQYRLKSNNDRAVTTVTMCTTPSSTAKPAAADALSEAWPVFAEKMKTSGEIPELEEWHGLIDKCHNANDQPGNGVWLLNLMRETGRRPTAVTYEKVLDMCKAHDDRVAAFHLVEHMYKDKVLLGDVELPDGMEPMLRKILPPDAFE